MLLMQITPPPTTTWLLFDFCDPCCCCDHYLYKHPHSLHKSSPPHPPFKSALSKQIFQYSLKSSDSQLMLRVHCSKVNTTVTEETRTDFFTLWAFFLKHYRKRSQAVLGTKDKNNFMSINSSVLINVCVDSTPLYPFLNCEGRIILCAWNWQNNDHQCVTDHPKTQQKVVLWGVFCARGWSN